MTQQPLKPAAHTAHATRQDGAGRGLALGAETRAGAKHGAVLPEPPVGRWQPITRWGKVGLVLLAVATTTVIMGHMLQPRLKLWAAKYARGELPGQLRPPCPPGSASAPVGCPGSTMPVLVLPITPAAPAAAALPR